MNIEKENKLCCSGNENECVCHDHNSIENDSGGDQINEGCGCGCGCGCGDGPGDKYLTIILEDDSKLECKIIGMFGCDGNTYIAILNPIEETVLLFLYNFNQDRTIGIEEDEEYEMVSKLFVAKHESQYEIDE